MTFQSVHKPSSSTLATQKQPSAFASRPFAVQTQQASSLGIPAMEAIERATFEHQKSEATELERRERQGTMTAEEREQLAMLRGQMRDFWANRMERASRLGHHFADIPVHRQDRPPTPGQANLTMQTPGGTNELAHEAWHVVQQKQGRVESTIQAKAVPVHADKELEKEAGVMGSQALQRRRGAQLTSCPNPNTRPAASGQWASGHAGTQVIQRDTWKERKHKFTININVLDKQKIGKRIRHKNDAEFGAQLRFLHKATKKGFKVNETSRWPQLRKAAEKYNKISYIDWKKHREAQHLIPAAIAMEYGVSDKLINSVENLMMLSGGRDKDKPKWSNAYEKIKPQNSKKRQQPIHIKYGQIAHPIYNKMVKQRWKEIEKKYPKLNEKQIFRKLADELRDIHNTQKRKFVDQLT